MLRPLLTSLMITAFCAVVSCTSTPQPIAPPSPLLNTKAMALSADDEGGVVLAGQAGAAPSEVVEISVANYSFDAAGAPSITRIPVAADGSFELSLPDSVPGDTYRLVTFSDSGEPLGAPLEITIEGDSLVEVSTSSCVSLQSDSIVSMGDVSVGSSSDVAVQITNDCEEDFTVSGLLLLGSDQWAVDPVGDTVLNAGDSMEVVFTWSPDTPSEEEQLLIVKGEAETFVLGVTALGTAE